MITRSTAASACGKHKHMEMRPNSYLTSAFKKC